MRHETSRNAKRSEKHARGLKRSVATRLSLLEKFNNALERGLTAAKAAEHVGVPRSSIRRWAATLAPEIVVTPNTSLAPFKITDSIHVLCSVQRYNRHRLLDALFNFIACLHFPRGDIDFDGGMLSLVTAYAWDGGLNERLSDLNKSDLEYVASRIPLGLLAKLSTWNSPLLDVFNSAAPDNNGYKPQDVIADSFWFFANCTTLRQSRPLTLRDLYTVYQYDVFPSQWFSSYESLLRFWQKYSDISIFRYVDRFSGANRFDIEPGMEDFKAAVDNLISDPKYLFEYFSKCKWVVAQLGSYMHVQTLRTMSPIQMPDQVAPQPFAPQENTRVDRTALADAGFRIRS